MKTRYITIIILIISIAFTSCKKILNTVSPNQVSDEDVFKNVEGLRNARIGMYATLEDQNYYGANYPLIAECYTDNGTTGGYDVIDLNDIASRTVQPSNIYIENMYIAIYNTIYTANKIINNVDKIQDDNADEKTNITGEAYFVRSLANFDLLRMFGEHWDKSSEYGISIVTTTDNVKTPVPRSTVEQSYSQIIGDLQTAINDLNTNNGSQYASLAAAKALLARVYLYHGDKTKAAAMATDVINDADYALLDAGSFTQIYTKKLSTESVFELVFDLQHPSFYNTETYLRDDALRSDVTFLANADLNTFFQGRNNDVRAQMADFTNVDVSIQPDGRTQKYRGEATKDNSAYVIRLAEMYLVRAEALGKDNGGIDDLNTLREARGMNDLDDEDISSDDDFVNAALDERRAELNFEGHRLFDLARTGKITDVLGEGVQPIMPIPQREIAATNGVVKQNPGY